MKDEILEIIKDWSQTALSSFGGYLDYKIVLERNFEKLADSIYSKLKPTPAPSTVAEAVDVKAKSDDYNDGDWKPKVLFYREQMQHIRKYCEVNNIGKPSQSLFDAIFEHLNTAASVPVAKNNLQDAEAMAEAYLIPEYFTTHPTIKEEKEDFNKMINCFIAGYNAAGVAKGEDGWEGKYKKCISVIKKFDAGIIGMYDL